MIRPAKLIHENGRTSKCYLDEERMLLYTEAITCEFALARGLRWKVDEDHPAQSEADPNQLSLEDLEVGR